MGVIAGVSGIFVWVHVRKLDEQEDELNYLVDGQFGVN